MGELYRGMLRRRECANAREDESRIARDKRTTIDARVSSRRLTDLSYFQRLWRRNFQDFSRYSVDFD